MVIRREEVFSGIGGFLREAIAGEGVGTEELTVVAVDHVVY